MTAARTTLEIHTDTPRQPVLHWPGKRLCVDVTPPAVRLAERFATASGQSGLLLHGDNRESLAWLLAQGYAGKVQLIYIDPPYDSGVT